MIINQQIKLLNILKFYGQKKSLDILNNVSNKIKPFISDKRLKRFEDSINNRNKRFIIVCENLDNPGNFAAVVRSADAIGIQNLCLINEGGNLDSNFEKYDRVSLGSGKWVTVNKYYSTTKCIEKLKEQGYSIWASDLSATAFQFDQLIFQPNKLTPQLSYFLSESIKNVNSLNNNNQEEEELIKNLAINELYNNNNKIVNNNNNKNFIRNDEKIALVFGNESNGISELMRSLSDRRFYLPMVGFVESFNISVSVAMTLSFLKMQGVITPDLSPLDKIKLLNKFVLSSIPKNKLVLEKLGFDSDLILKLIK
ncbi:hypothetical protein DDB_G0271370 [Dictyostelium discoideum AX4]|uniref:tRNA/rRNA methyltransferase SpoU type domain-containing protein n=1 Tax=Dictyostelium discoideum TaxID=44689 RepID=Q55BF9_DICDI|nr:hypothetical protein DDB_G0271370 [Dictyostelium discoideum AX4]EAL71815.1 hypothetical protein DDB_G0271370 [Dictyostelium discoideum AX4]|eukprot:XP_645653.1 hypothetical protein DDB_G0271370 [Dictyostelium discoideum AX4]